ncbi:major facilitator superfamily transporter [Thozetella sp. PMI_491]|nr:major facilitator superfamily transporter [Thozetella sp. PMI_491]
MMKESSVQEAVSQAPSSVSTDNDRGSLDYILVSFEENDPVNPHNWKRWKKAMVVVTATVISINSSLGSALTSNLMPYLQETFHVPDGPQTVLPASVYLMGFVCGPLIFAPLSEAYGRKPVLLVGFSGFTIWTVASPLAPNWPAFLIFRFLSGTFGAPPLSVMGGCIADVFVDSKVRGIAMMSWSAATFIGPLTAPIVGGFLGRIDWHWAFWVALIFAALSAGFLIWLPETLAAKLLRTKAKKLNKANNSEAYISPYDLERGSLLSTLGTTLTRPVRLLCNEMLLTSTCIYMAFVYASFYMLLVISTRIFQNIYHFSPGISGVCFLMIALGTIIGCCIQVWFDNRLAPRLAAKHPRKRPEYLRLPLACIGGPCFMISLLWLGWSAKAEIHWIVPLLATVPYGLANQLIFMALINYVADAYGVYSASALAACGATRSFAGALIPLAVTNMLEALGIAWSCTLLAFIAAALCAVPFCFIIWGEKIRSRSRFSSGLQQQAEMGLTRSISLV